jgi:hypothetical protein
VLNPLGNVIEFEVTVGDPLNTVTPDVVNFTNTGAFIVIDKSPLDVAPEFGVDAFTLNVKVVSETTAVAVPLITPDELSDSPGGKLPETNVVL